MKQLTHPLTPDRWAPRSSLLRRCLGNDEAPAGCVRPGPVWDARPSATSSGHRGRREGRGTRARQPQPADRCDAARARHSAGGQPHCSTRQTALRASAGGRGRAACSATPTGLPPWPAPSGGGTGGCGSRSDGDGQSGQGDCSGNLALHRCPPTGRWRRRGPSEAARPTGSQPTRNLTARVRARTASRPMPPVRGDASAPVRTPRVQVLLGRASCRRHSATFRRTGVLRSRPTPLAAPLALGREPRNGPSCVSTARSPLRIATTDASDIFPPVASTSFSPRTTASRPDITSGPGPGTTTTSSS